jgi:hypothetical protein
VFQLPGRSLENLLGEDQRERLPVGRLLVRATRQLARMRMTAQFAAGLVRDHEARMRRSAIGTRNA